MKRFPLMGLFLLLCRVGSGQFDVDYKRLVLKYPGESVVVLKNCENLTIKSGKKGLDLNTEIFTEKIYLSSRLGNASEASVNYTSFDSITQIEASVFVPGTKKYKQIKVKDFKTTNRMSRRVFYDGGKTISFFYPSMKDGVKTNLRYNVHIADPHLIPIFFFQEYTPVLHSEYTLTANNDMDIGWKLYNVSDTAVHFSKTTHGDMVTYSWIMNNVPAFSPEENEPALHCSIPHLVTWIKSAKVDGEEKHILRNASDLYAWYYSYIQKVDNTPSRELKAIVDSLKGLHTDELERVKSIYSWVQNNIKYIAFEDGMGGFVPRSGSSVCEKRFGDCKDMANIIHTMLLYAGIPSYLTWVGTRELPYTYEENPTPATDDHMITTYIKDGRYYYLDATGPFTPCTLPSRFIQGKEVLIGKGKDDFEIRKVPVVEAGQNKLTDSVELQVKGTRIDGKGNTLFEAYHHIMIANLLSASAQKQKLALREYYMRGSNKFILDSFNIQHIYDPYKDGQVRYYFNIEDYAKINGDEIYVNMNLNKDFITEYIKKDRKQPVEKEDEEIQTEVITLKIPEGYHLEYLPENANYTNEKFGFDLSYKKTANAIIQTNRVYSKTLLLNPSDFNDWNKQIKELQKAFAELVILKKNKP